jgi:crotonobetainyl-CoA:carnitine CoA-transferase CaiB-like acyl-CoA transferase
MRVLDMSRLLPGPLCTLYLADLGAEVIKIEDPQLGDYARATLFPPEGEGGMSRFFREANRGKKSVALDLADSTDRGRFHELVRSADILIEGFRPGVVDRLGANYELLSSINPRLVYISITGYGQQGDKRLTAGHDLNYLAYAGVLDQLRDINGTPIVPEIQIADVFGGAMHAVTAALAGLVRRERSGQGCYVDVSMTDCCKPLNIAALTLPDRAASPIGGNYACYNVYRTSDGGHVTLGAAEPKFWANFCNAVGMPELIRLQYEEGETREATKAALDRLFQQHTRDEWCDLLSDVDCCFAPVLRPEDALEPGGPAVLMPLKFAGQSQPRSTSAPQLGEHNLLFFED